MATATDAQIPHKSPAPIEVTMSESSGDTNKAEKKRLVHLFPPMRLIRD